MSIEGDSTRVDISTLELLRLILVQQRIQTAILREMTGFEVNEEDILNDDNL